MWVTMCVTLLKTFWVSLQDGVNGVSKNRMYVAYRQYLQSLESQWSV